MSDFCELALTCASQKEADKIAESLLDKHLIACAKFIPIESKYRWQGKIEGTKEVLVLMESRTNLFTQIEREVAKLHSYETFVLKMLPLTSINQKAAGWLKGETNG